MTKKTKGWEQPKLNRLGTLSDVAGAKKTASDPGGSSNGFQTS